MISTEKEANGMKKSPVIKHIGTALLLGAVAGAATGVAVTLYKFCAKHVIHLSEHGYEYLRHQPIWLIPTVAALVVLALVLAHIYRHTSNLRGGGIPTAIGVLRGWFPLQWVRNAIGVFTLSLTTFLVGVPLGNEGPSVQLGTAIGQGCTALFGKRAAPWSRYGMTGGACAGFSTATGAPISGVLFAVEEAHHRISPIILLIATAAVSTARLVSELLAPVLGVSTNLFPTLQLPALEWTDSWIPLAIGILFGLFAVVFLSFYRYASDFLNKKLANVPHQWKILAILLLTLGMGLLSFSYISTGHELILSLFDGEAILILVVLLAIRTLLTVGANVTQLTGGIFLPILAIGALLSTIFADGVQWLFGLDGSYYPVILVLGITACIAGMMKMPMTAIAFAVEALSGAGIILPILLAATMAYGVAELFGAVSINDRVLHSRMEQMRKGHTSRTAETVVTVQRHSFADGKEIRDILWPNGLYVLSVDKKHVRGDSALHAGDNLRVRYTTFQEAQLKQELFAIVGESK